MRQELKADFAEGWKDGEASERRRMTLSMLDLGIPEDTILAATGVTKEQLAEMKKAN